MAGIKTPGIDLDFSWPLVAALGIVAALVIYVVYDVFNSSGVSSAVNSASGVVSSAAGLVQAPVDAVTGAIKTVTGSDSNVPGSNSNLFYEGLANFFQSGSIFNDDSAK